MKTLANHAGMVLRNDAAESWDRFERAHGVHAVNSAYRSQATQNGLIYRYDHPKSKYDRPPYLFKPAKKSRHTLGVAIDTPNAKAVARIAGEYGWRFLFEYDAVHLEYDPAYDRHKGGTATPTPVGKIAEDSVLGQATIRRMQHDLGTPEDGKISGKSTMVAALQRRLNAQGFRDWNGKPLAVDGKGFAQNGKKTRTVYAFQKYMGVKPDGVLSKPKSGTILAVQRRLNRGTL